MKRFKHLGFYIAAILIILMIVLIFFRNTNETRMKYSEVVDYFHNKQVTSFSINDNVLTFTTNVQSETGEIKEVSYEFKLYDPAWFWNDVSEDVEQARAEGIIKEYDLTPAEPTPFWLSIIPYVIFLVVIMIIFHFMFNQLNGANNKAMSFGKARLKLQNEEKKKITFKEVAGADEEKQELAEIVEFLKNPKRYTDLGARIPRGLLLVGAPGTGKTYLARATAGEAGVPFFSISGSDFVELYVGIGAARVRDTFEQAKKNAPCIVFIDEIDAVGRQRGAGLGGGHDEKEQTLNQLLVEMDGFTQNEGVIIMAATNRPDILDSALLRPGRFDRQIVINLPDVNAREAILKVHAIGKPLSKDVDLAVIAKTTAGYTPADLENILNESAMMAARRHHTEIKMEDIEDAIMKVLVGVEKKTRKISDKERKLTAYHETGHAIITKVLQPQNPVHQISIIPRGMAGGFTLSLPQEDKSYMSKNEMFDEIVVLLGGRTAEALFLDDISTGASNDIERATSIANKMVTRYGMSDNLGPIAFGSSHDEIFLGRDFGTTKNYSEEVAKEIDVEIKKIIDAAYEKAKSILKSNEESLKNVATILIEKEKLSGEEFTSIMETGHLPETDVTSATDDEEKPQPETQEVQEQPAEENIPTEDKE